MSAVGRNQIFSAVHTIGGLIPSDMLTRIAEGKDVEGARPADYLVAGSRSVRDDAERHWDFLKSVWAELREQLPVAPEADTPADLTGAAVASWLLPLFSELGFGPLAPIAAGGIAADDGGKSFPISHRWRHVPIHLVPWHAGLDRRPAGAGAIPPQSLVQECLNRTGAHLWGVLSNGRQLRLLRDSSALATSSYVEFDLEAIFDGELFSEFTLLYRLLHVSRFDTGADDAPSACWLEKWRAAAISSGTRALDQLREGVRAAITVLGTGFLRHPGNTRLREHVDARALHNALLRLAYRLLFVFVAEDRDVLHPPDADALARERYARYFSSARLRAHARRRRGSAHGDLYQALRIVLDSLGDEHGRPELGLPGLGGLFDDTDADAPLRGLSLSNEHLLAAVRHLSQVRDAGSRRWRTIDYRHLGAEELGSIYESLLELVPRHSAVDREFHLEELAGNSRKTTGSYYTPASLIDCLLDSTLDPVLDDAIKRGEQAAAATGAPEASEAIVAALLSLTVCDPACGSGHFLVAAARRIAKRVAAVRERNPEPTIDAVRHALHQVVARCVYGVDLNPMAVELAKVSLWLEALEPGKALGFLDAHIKHGNALVGATPALLRGGIPDEAFKPIDGDDPKIAKSLRERNAKERKGQASLFDASGEAKVANAAFAAGLRRIASAPSDKLHEVRRQAAAYRDWSISAEYARAVHVADAWCAAFVWRMTADAPPPVTEEVFRRLQDPDAEAASQRTHDEIVRLREQHRFFHWHLEFPDVFTVPGPSAGSGPDSGPWPGPEVASDVDAATGWAGGFDCVLGNPPWEHLELKEQEFFSAHAPDIALMAGTKRKRRIERLEVDDPVLYHAYEDAKRQVDDVRHFASESQVFPFCGRGRIKTDSIFAEQGRCLTGSRGRMGMIIPTGIATDATTARFFRDLVQTRTLVSLFDFENEEKVFASVHHSFRFALLTVSGTRRPSPRVGLVFRVRQADQIATRAYSLAPEEITLLNPNTGTCPVFNSRRDAEITLDIYRRVPVLIKGDDLNGNPWGLSFMQGLFNMANDSALFCRAEELEPEGWRLDGNVYRRGDDRMLPLYEAKMAHHFDHRFSTYRDATQEQLNVGTLPRLTNAQHADPDQTPIPRYWVAASEVAEALGGDARRGKRAWDHGWMLGWRDICRSTDERTVIASVVPRVAVGHKLLMAFPSKTSGGLQANLSAFAFDYIARQKLSGTSMGYFIVRQLAVLPPQVYDSPAAWDRATSVDDWVTSRVLELAYTSHDIADYARDLGDHGAPFVWDAARRELLRAELDAAYFHLYGVDRDDVDYIMDTFKVVREKDEKAHGEYRTKRIILDIYDAMRKATDAGTAYQTVDPSPGHGPRHPA